MTVNELARKLKVAPDTVRYYTRIGLLQPRKAAGNGYHHYSERDEERLRFASWSPAGEKAAQWVRPTSAKGFDCHNREPQS